MDDLALYKQMKQKLRKKLESSLPKVSKDDIELLKVRQKEIKELERFLPNGVLGKTEQL